HACNLGLQVGGVVDVDAGLHGDTLGDGNAVAAQVLDLGRVIGEQAHTAHVEVGQDFDRRPVFALVGLVAKHQVGVNRVVAFVLEIVGAQLLGKADAAAFLAQIDHDSPAGLGDALHGHVQLFATVAAQRAERVARHAFGVNAHQDLLAV